MNRGKSTVLKSSTPTTPPSEGFARVALCARVAKHFADVAVGSTRASGRAVVAVRCHLLVHAALNGAVGRVVHVETVTDVAEQARRHGALDAIEVDVDVVECRPCF